MLPFLSWLLATAAGPAIVPPDYTATAGPCCEAPTTTIRHHAGRIRRDELGYAGRLTSEYRALGSRAVITVDRNSRGEVVQFEVRLRGGPDLLNEMSWIDTGARRTIAGENCRVQRRVGAPLQRCATADSVDLLPSSAFGDRTIEITRLVRGPVDPAEVTPPLDLLDLARWAPAEAFQDHPESHRGDYVAVFARHGTISRSGAWTQTVLGFTTTIANEAIPLAITTAVDGTHLQIDREPSRGRSPFQPTMVKGKTGEKLFGETCRWRATIASVDTSLYECRATDGALLALGEDNIMLGQLWEPARSFRRIRVPLAAVMPPAEQLAPEHYGLSR